MVIDDAVTQADVKGRLDEGFNALKAGNLGVVIGIIYHLRPHLSNGKAESLPKELLSGYQRLVRDYISLKLADGFTALQEGDLGMARIVINSLDDYFRNGEVPDAFRKELKDKHQRLETSLFSTSLNQAVHEVERIIREGNNPLYGPALSTLTRMKREAERLKVTVPGEVDGLVSQLEMKIGGKYKSAA